MKKFIFLFTALILTGFTVYADTNNAETNTTSTFYNGYGNSFIFVEGGIEFSIFRDGQFDFNLLNNSRLNLSIASRNASISFNSGYNYNSYVQYDEFGAIIQIENTPIYYDYYGRVNRVGNVNVFYNNLGYISRVGGLYVHYNRYNNFNYYTGFINVYNTRYVYRPWHNYYALPPRNFCVVYNRPYRQFYNPIRYVYNRPFYNNYRPTTSVYGRRGHNVARNKNYATANRSSRNVTKVNRNANIGRSVAKILQAFKAKIIAVDPYVTDDSEFAVLSLEDALPQADIITIHSIPYAFKMDDGIGYIRIRQFNRFEEMPGGYGILIFGRPTEFSIG